MDSITIKTARFGEIEIDQSKVIHFISPILGFEGLLDFVLLDHSEDSPFKWLQSLNDSALAFVVTSPKLFGIDYKFPLSTELAGKLELKSSEEALVLTIVNIPQEDPGKMTTNLLGPLIVNQGKLKAVQIVLSDTEYSTKTRLIPDEILSQHTVAPSTEA